MPKTMKLLKSNVIRTCLRRAMSRYYPIDDIVNGLTQEEQQVSCSEHVVSC